MKLILTSAITIFYLNSWAQLNQDKCLITSINDDYKFIIYGEEYDLNDSILTVKPKSGVMIPSDIEIKNQNRLGFIYIRIPLNENIVNYREKLLKSGLYESVDYNGSFKYYWTPNDPDAQANQWYLDKINMDDAWEFATGDTSIVVAVIDNGVMWTHDDLGLGYDSYQNIYLNYEEAWSSPDNPLSGDQDDDDENGKVDDYKGWNFDVGLHDHNDSRPYNHSHGTMIAGIISAKTNNNRFIAGIAGGNNRKGIKILPIGIGDPVPHSEYIADAIFYAVDMGAKIISLSFGARQSEYIPDEAAITNAIYYAEENNVVVVCCSGENNEDEVAFPASVYGVISVGGITQNNIRMSGSSYGELLDLVAPGVEIFGLNLNNYWEIRSGVSFASPMVAATAALILSINNNLDIYEVEDILISTAYELDAYTFSMFPGRNYPWNQDVGYGLLDAQAALQAAVCYSPIENTTYSSDVELSGCMNGIQLTNVIVQNNSSLSIEAAHSVTINGIFEVKIGSILDIH